MRPVRLKKINPEAPVWLQPEAVPGSAVRHIASLSPSFDRVEWVPASGNKKMLSIGRPPSAQWIRLSEEVTATDGKGRVRTLGSLRVFSQWSQQFSALEQEAVRMMAKELGEQWPRG